MRAAMRFALVTDTHYWLGDQVADSSLWNRQLFTCSKELGERLTVALKALAPDFVIHAGDLTHQGDAQSFDYAAEVLHSVGVPVYVTPGNHDTGDSAMRSRLTTLFPESGASSLSTGFSYRRSLGPLDLVVLDTNSANTVGGQEDFDVHWLAAKQQKYHIGPSLPGLTWLDGVLAGLGSSRALLMLHHPVVGKDSYPRRLPHDSLEPEQRLSVPDETLFARHSLELRALIQRHASSLIAVVCGHWHINDLYLFHDVPVIQTCSLMEFPFEFRVFDVGPQMLEGQMKSIATPELISASLVQEWKNSWVQGDSTARTISIALR